MSYSSEGSTLLQDLVHKKRFGKTLRDISRRRTKKSQSVKSLPSKSNGKGIQTLKLTSKKQAAGKVLPTHGILKNHNRAALAQKKSVIIDDTQEGNLLESCCALVKHVTFSGKDDILGHNKAGSHLDLPPLRTLCKIFSNVLAASSATKDSDIGALDAVGTQLVNESDMGVAVDLIENGDMSFKSSAISLTKKNSSATKETPLGVDLNSSVQISGDLDCPFSGNTQITSSVCREGVNSGRINGNGRSLDAHVTGSFPYSIESCISQIDPACSLNIACNIPSQPPTSCSVASVHENGKQSHLCVGPVLDYISGVPDLQRKGNLSSNDIISICSSVGSNTFREPRFSSDSIPNHRDKCINEDFIGLPLNSQGELMKFFSSSKYGFRDLLKKQNTAEGSLHDFQVASLSDLKSNKDFGNMKAKFPDVPLCQNDRSKWFSEQLCPPNRQLVSGLGITGLQTFDSRQIQRHESAKDQNKSIQCSQDQIKATYYRCLGHYQTHNLREGEKLHADGNLDNNQPASPPTMRLMGKNVTVGKINNESQVFRDGNAWREKEILSEQCSLVRMYDKPHDKRWPQQEWVAQSSPGTSNGNIFQQCEAPGCACFSAIQSNCEQMSFPYSVPFDCQEQWMSNGGFPSTNNIYSQHQALQGTSPKPMFNCNSPSDLVKMGHQIPGVSSHARDVYQHMLLSSTHCKHSQNLCHSTSSILHPLIANQGHGNFVGSLSAPSSSHLPQWLLNPEGKKQYSSCRYSDQFARYQPCAAITSNPLTFPSSYPTSRFTFPVSSPASIAQPSLASAYPTSNFYPTVNTSYRSNCMNKCDPNSEFKYVEDLEKADRLRKRPACKNDEFMRPVKRPNQTQHWYSHTPIEPRRRELHQQLGSQHKRMNVNHPIISSNKTSLGGSSSKLGPFELDGELRSGPVKLSAGAKHILKPVQSTDQDDSRLIHSTIPFGIGSSSSKLPVPVDKSTKNIQVLVCISNGGPWMVDSSAIDFQMSCQSTPFGYY